MRDSCPRDSAVIEKRTKPYLSRKEVVLSALSLVATVALCIVAIYYKDYLLDTTYVTRYGLLGVLITAFVAGSTVSLMAIPVPYWLLVFTLPPLLAPQWGIAAPIVVGAISGLGASLGQSLTFMIGWGSKDLSQKLATKINRGVYAKAVDWAQQHGSLAVFVMSAIINPFHLPMTFAMASLHYPGWKFFLFSLLGNVVKSSVIAFCGYFGLASLFHFLGV